MAGGKDQKSANRMISDAGRTTERRSADFETRNTADLNASRGRADDLYGSLRGGYQSMADGAASNMPAGAAGGGGGGGGAPSSGASFGGVRDTYDNFMKTGGINPDESATLGSNAARMRQIAEQGGDPEARSGYSEFAKTGGWDPSRVASMDSNIAGLKAIGQTGGVDATGQSRMRGAGVFDEFAQTGGLSASDQANIRSRATATIPSFFGQAKANANRQAAVQGGYGPGSSALMSRFGREQAAAGADASLNAELGIRDRVNSGRMTGAQNLASSEAGLQGLMSSNKLAGLTGASSVESGMINDINRGRQFGIGGLDQMSLNDREIGLRGLGASNDATMGAIGLRNQGVQYGTEGMRGLAESDRGAAMSGAASSAAQDRWAQEFALRQKSMGLEGLQGLYGAMPSEYMANKEFDQGNTFGFAGSQGDLGSRLKTGNKSWMDYVSPLAGAASAFA